MKPYINKSIICILFLLILGTLTMYGQQNYIVNVNTYLNVRNNANENAEVIGTLKNGETVCVYDFNGNWAKISYKNGYGYINREYIHLVSAHSSNKTSKKTKTFSLDINKGLFNSFPVSREWIYVIILLSGILFIIRLIRKEKHLEGKLHLFNWIIFTLACIAEIIYILCVQDDVIWFCIPDKVGWVATIINFLLFGFIVYNQLMCLFNTLTDVQYNSYAVFDWRWGIYSWPAAVLAGLICGFFFQPGLMIVGILFLIAQIIQLVIVFKNVVPKGGIGHAILCSSVYSIGSIATFLALVHFLILLVIVLVALFILSIIGKVQEAENNKRCSNCSHLSGSYCYKRGETIYNPSSKVCNSHS